MAQQVVPKKYGPYGSQLPENYTYQLAEGQRVKEVLINHGSIVDSIGFVVQLPDHDNTFGEKPVCIVKFGGKGGDHSKIKLGPGEVLTRISGTYGKYGDIVVIGSIKIHTNYNKEGYGPYGDKKTDPVDTFTSPELPLPQPIGNHFIDQIVGIVGRANNYVESIGVFKKIE